MRLVRYDIPPVVKLREAHEMNTAGILHLIFRFRVARFENLALSGTIHDTRNLKLET